MTLLQKAARAAVALLDRPRQLAPSPASTAAVRSLPNPLRRGDAGVWASAPLPVRPSGERPGRDVTAATAATVVTAAAAVTATTAVTAADGVAGEEKERAADARAPRAVGQRERRGPRPDRRRADRRRVDQGSPYGERRSGGDDRHGDRREAATPAAGISLTRDYFVPSDRVVVSDGTAVAPDRVTRFHE